MDIIDNAHQIKEAKKQAVFVFVIVHGGHEYYNLPSPRMQKQYRFYAEQGADIVIGHHTHCISGNEIHKGVPIYYSLGNFLFTKDNIQEDWYKGLVLEVEIKEAKLFTQLYPVKQQETTFELSLLQNEEKEVVFNRITTYNSIIADQSKLKTEWNSYVDSKYDEYLNYWSPLSFLKNRYLGAVLRRLPLKFINKKGLVLYLNLIRCEAHRDMSEEVMGKYLKR
jgi:poly-gamma-glutamate synthesis protein (capsule biosynthesis protein)